METVPLSIIRDLRCRHCSAWLSCAPIYIVPHGGNLCGRCRMLAKPFYRNYIYEAIALIYKFPCKYWTKRCNRPLQWNENFDHEPNCKYQSACSIFCSHPSLCCSSPRKLPQSGNGTETISLWYIPDAILLTLKCVYCDGYLCSSPVFTTPEGKSVCHRCVHANGAPRTCLPNLTYEILAAHLIFPCVYHRRGCVQRHPFGPQTWRHEQECPFGRPPRPETPKKAGKKEKGVIQTHSGHIYATITSQSALFAPPKTHAQNSNVNSELAAKIRQKGDGDEKSFDGESLDDGVSSRASTLADNVSRNTLEQDASTLGDNVSRSTDGGLSEASFRAPFGYKMANDGGYSANYHHGGFPAVHDDGSFGRSGVRKTESFQMNGVISELRMKQRM